ncbi:LysR family transcriptional regulator [Psychromonas sp. Urea-02u-13]|uniref:LysR family transcriptional regulator n=1 Tax=Psychromonas sp. Urea-02u-13 TaxID=2058326 RepID=UPI000C348FDF|nr:LysR family transcriptional regulator [Psychromonas sp. Urea-02u-13]PKG38036.1 LysR family transcriptional regulator [Psychromonas sp. Urea-02u-13]
MDLIQLSRINFKHLAVLHVMLSTHSVTQSAGILCMSSSSVSKNLSQLRSLLKDELFYRDGTQLVPTPYALKVGPTVHMIINNMNGLLHQTGFEAQLFTGKFALSMRESTFEIFAPAISEILSHQAPNAQVEIHSKEQFGFDALLSGQVDVIILPHDKSQPPSNEKQLVWETLIEDEMICVMRSTHPLAKQTLTIENYLAYKHIGIFDKELNQPYFEQLLKQQYHERETVISVADFGSAATICQQSDFLFTCSKKWFEVAKQAQGLIEKPLPFDYGQVAYSMVFNKLARNDQALSWLFNNIKEALKQPDS